MRSIGLSEKRSEINHFIFDNRIDVFFFVETWLKDLGDKPKIADVTPIGYADRSFPRLNRSGGLAIIARSHILQHIAFSNHLSVLSIIRLNCFKQLYLWKKVCQFFLSLQTPT